MSDLVYDYNVSGEAKYQIFISSTYEDLKEERQQVIKEIVRAEQFPVAMENFVASSKEQWATIERFLQTSGCLILILGTRYGTIDESDDKNRSFTEKEYDYADENGIPVLAFVATGDRYKNNRKNAAKLKAFIGKVKNSKRLVCYFSSCADLSGAVARSIANEKLNFINPWYCKTEVAQCKTNNTTTDGVLSLNELPINNYWNENAIHMFEKYEPELSKLTKKWNQKLEWKGGKDFHHLFEIRDDNNVISDAQRDEGITKSIRYVSTDKSGNMWVTGWYLQED